MDTERLEQQMQFIVEVDRLKHVLRRNSTADGARLENDAEHSWHLALMALVLAEHANAPVDVSRVVRMLIIHDIVEIDAGDAFLYDDAGRDDKAAREAAAAERIFGLLPDDQATEMRALWDEFEVRETIDARFASALDRLQPLLLNRATRGATWAQYNLTSDRVLAVNASIEHGTKTLWNYAATVIDEAVAEGYLASG